MSSCVPMTCWAFTYHQMSKPTKQNLKQQVHAVNLCPQLRNPPLRWTATENRVPRAPCIYMNQGFPRPLSHSGRDCTKIESTLELNIHTYTCERTCLEREREKRDSKKYTHTCMHGSSHGYAASLEGLLARLP